MNAPWVCAGVEANGDGENSALPGVGDAALNTWLVDW